MWLKQSTAVTVKIGPFVDTADGFTAVTALTIAQADIRLTKNGAAFAQTNNATGATHDENGYYGVPLDATDTATLGTLRVAINKGGALPVWQDFMVVPANVWDSMFGASLLKTDLDTIKTNPVINGGTVTFPTNATLASTTNLTAGTVATVTNAVTANVTQIDGQATSGNNATLNLKKLNIVNNAGDALVASSTGSNGSGISASGNGTGYGIAGTGGTTNGHGILAQGTGDGSGLHALGGGGNSHGIAAIHSGTGSDLYATTTPLTLVKTTNITGFNDIAATAVVSSGAITTSGGAVSTVTTAANLTNAPTNGDLTAAMKASVNAEVVDCLNVDTYGEPTGVPGATVSLVSKLGRLYQALRNKLKVTASAKTFTDDAGADLWSKGLSDNGTTYEESEGA
jgi:hypothetical protein